MANNKSVRSFLISHINGAAEPQPFRIGKAACSKRAVGLQVLEHFDYGTAFLIAVTDHLGVRTIGQTEFCGLIAREVLVS